MISGDEFGVLGVVTVQSVCRVLGHRRSKRKARPLATTWSSECWVCCQRIVRIRHRQWILMRDIHHHASAFWGPTFARTWPIDRSFSFDELLEAIDDATSDIKEAG